MDQNTLQVMLREAVRETVTEVLQTLLEADREAFLREYGGRKNGYYPRKLETSFGQMELAIPRDREGRYYPSLLQPYTRRQVDVGEVAVALYAAGVSQRKAAEVMSLLLGHRYTHETISAITDQVLKGVKEFAERPLPEEMALVYLDGFFLKVLREGLGVERAAVYVALGVTPCGARRVLGFWLLPTENASAWEGVLGELWRRGLRRVLLFVTDGLPGIAVHLGQGPQSRGDPPGVSPGPVAAVCGAPGEGQPGPGALPGQGFGGPRPEGGVHGGEWKRGPGGFGEAEGGLGGQVPFLGGLLVGELRGVAAFLRVPPGAMALSAEHQPDGEVYP